MKNKNILLVGSGFMAREYLKVISQMDYNVTIVGRGLKRINALKADYPLVEYYTGGLENFLKDCKLTYDFAINAVSVDQLKASSLQLIEFGIKRLLVEKPGDLTTSGLIEIKTQADLQNAKVYIAYNRRFYTSVIKMLHEIEIDKGAISVHFEFTEWIHTISPEMYCKDSLEKWIISNSSHVIDTAFFITGLPKVLNVNVQGENEIPWHPSGSVFTGSGIGSKNIPFTYHSNWKAPGRWSVEVLTKNRRFYLKPMEKLYCQLKGSVEIKELQIADQLDQDFKAGLFLQTEAFLKSDFAKLNSLEDQIETNPFYDKIGSY